MQTADVLICLALMLLQTPAHTMVSPDALPPPGRSSYLRVPLLIHRPDGWIPRAPAGFKVQMYATGLKSPRWLLVGPNGDAFVTESYQGRIILLRDKDHTGVADSQTVFASGLNLPTGMAIQDGSFWVANTDSVERYDYRIGQDQIANPQKIVTGIPSRGYRQHWTRNILFDPDGNGFYLTIGSETNKDPEELPRGAIWHYNSDGTGQELVASGLRNPVGLAWEPESKQLWTTCVERDYMGDDLVPDFFTSINKGDFFGWPYFYIGKNADPSVSGGPSNEVKTPDVLFHAHSTPLELMFYTGQQFPQRYRGDAFISMRGSTNRTHKSGYKVVRVHFENGKATPGYEDFLWGFVPDDTARQVYGRPVGVAQMPDGSMLVADEGGHCVWRVSYIGKP